MLIGIWQVEEQLVRGAPLPVRLGAGIGDVEDRLVVIGEGVGEERRTAIAPVDWTSASV